MNFERISGHTGHLVLNTDGAIISSGGDLENNERIAANISKILKTVGRGDFGSAVEKISINYADHSFLVCSWSKKIYVVKKNTPEEINA